MISVPNHLQLLSGNNYFFVYAFPPSALSKLFIHEGLSAEGGFFNSAHTSRQSVLSNTCVYRIYILLTRVNGSVGTNHPNR